jgi:hypothetical protein
VENINEEILIQLLDQMHDQIHDDRKLAIGLLSRADKLDEDLSNFMQTVNLEDAQRDQRRTAANVIPIRDTDGDH